MRTGPAVRDRVRAHARRLHGARRGRLGQRGDPGGDRAGAATVADFISRRRRLRSSPRRSGSTTSIAGTGTPASRANACVWPRWLSTSRGRPRRTSCSIEARGVRAPDPVVGEARRAGCGAFSSARKSHPSAAATASVSFLIALDKARSPSSAPISACPSRVSAESGLPAALLESLRQISALRSAETSAGNPEREKRSTIARTRSLAVPSGSPKT